MKRKSVAILIFFVVVITGAAGFGIIPLLPLGTMRVSAWYSTPPGVDGGYIGGYKIVVILVSGPQNAVGMTTTDPRNPLLFRLLPGTYNVSSIYNQIFISENVTVTWGESVEIVLIFGGIPHP